MRKSPAVRWSGIPGFSIARQVRLLQYDPGLPLALSVELGERYCACLWLQHTPDHSLLVLDEYVAGGRTFRENVEGLLGQHRKRGYGRIAWVSVDPDPNYTHTLLRLDYGLPTTFRRPAGVEQVHALLPRIVVDQGCEETIRELSGASEVVPCLDALRYATAVWLNFIERDRVLRVAHPALRG